MLEDVPTPTLEESEVACLAHFLPAAERRYLKKLLMVAGILQRLHYSDERIAGVLWHIHNAPGDLLGLGVNLSLILNLRVGDTENGQEGLAGSPA